MDVVSILSLGAIGLGFLLAYLAYRLLAGGQTNERTIYVFMVFCLTLVAVRCFNIPMASIKQP